MYKRAPHLAPPRMGTGVMIVKEGHVLLGKRKSTYGDGEYSFVGGHLENGERFEECALRETKEECGLQVKNLKFLVVANIKAYLPRHFVLIGFTAEWVGGEPELLEPHKFESWQWYPLDKLPKPLFYPTGIMLKAYAEKMCYRDE